MEKTYEELYRWFNSEIHEYVEKTYPSPVCLTDSDLDELGVFLHIREMLRYAAEKKLNRDPCLGKIDSIEDYLIHYIHRALTTKCANELLNKMGYKKEKEEKLDQKKFA